MIAIYKNNEKIGEFTKRRELMEELVNLKGKNISPMSEMIIFEGLNNDGYFKMANGIELVKN